MVHSSSTISINQPLILNSFMCYSLTKHYPIGRNFHKQANKENDGIAKKSVQEPARSGCVRVSLSQSIWLYPFSKGTLARTVVFLAEFFCSGDFNGKMLASLGTDFVVDSLGWLEAVLVTVKDKEPTLASFLELESFVKPSFHKIPLSRLVLVAFEDSSSMEISAISEASLFVWRSTGALTYTLMGFYAWP